MKYLFLLSFILIPSFSYANTEISLGAETSSHIFDILSEVHSASENITFSSVGAGLSVSTDYISCVANVDVRCSLKIIEEEGFSSHLFNLLTEVHSASPKITLSSSGKGMSVRTDMISCSSNSGQIDCLIKSLIQDQ